MSSTVSRLTATLSWRSRYGSRRGGGQIDDSNDDDWTGNLPLPYPLLRGRLLQFQ